MNSTLSKRTTIACGISSRFIFLMLLLYTTEVRASDEIERIKVASPLAVTMLGQSFELELNDLVEGLARGFDVEVTNSTGQEIKDITTKVSCGCLKIIRISAVDISPSSNIVIRFAVLPTSSGFEQKCAVAGVLANGDRKEFFSINLKGAVVPPISAAKYATSVAGFAKGPFTTNISHVDGVSIEYDLIASRSDTFTVVGDESDSSIVISPKGKQLEGEYTLHVSIPFTWKEQKFTHTLQIQIVEDSIRLSPSRLYFRKTSSGRIATLLVNTKAIGVSPRDCSIFLLDKDGEVLKTEFEVKLRDLDAHSVLCTLQIDDRVMELTREISFRAVTKSEVFVRTVKCIFE